MKTTVPRFCFLWIFLFLAGGFALFADEQSEPRKRKEDSAPQKPLKLKPVADSGAAPLGPGLFLPDIQNNALFMNILTRIMSETGEELWNKNFGRVTVAGRPVKLKLLGENIVAEVQLTPYSLRDGELVLVAQSQIWSSAGGVMHYETDIKAINLKLFEKVYYFPLGSNSMGEDFIEISIEVKPVKKAPPHGRMGNPE